MIDSLHAWLREHEDDLLRDYRAMLQIDSIEGPAEPNAPYGAGNRRALDLALKLCADSGMATKDLEGHIGFGEFGSGERLIVSLGHLDVVPVGPGWKHAPFGAEVDGGYVYARGAIDDKGPTMASFYAMRAIQACCPDLDARFRQVFGCDEESGFGCVERYVQTEEAPTYGVAPDSGWPLYHAEKGIVNLELSIRLPSGGFELIELTGGQAPNIVIDSCSAKVRVSPEVRAEVESRLEDAWDRNVTYSWEEGNVLGVFATGKAAHGSTPFMGDSAATRAIRFLFGLSPVEVREAWEDLLDMTHPGGAGLGIAGSDEPSRDLTANVGFVKVVEGSLEMLVNVRYPVTWTGDRLREMCENYLAKLELSAKVEVTRDSPPLYFPLEHPMVAAIVDVYEKETGERKKPGTMGGGTYARAIPNTVSIGTGWEGDGDAHQTDERLKIENLYRMSRIYAHILYRLATL